MRGPWDQTACEETGLICMLGTRVCKPTGPWAKGHDARLRCLYEQRPSPGDSLHNPEWYPAWILSLSLCQIVTYMLTDVVISCLLLENFIKGKYSGSLLSYTFILYF